MKLSFTGFGKIAASAAICLALAAVAPAASAQQQPPAKTGAADAQKPSPDKRPWSVQMSRNTPHTFTVKANEAKLTEIAAELGRLTKVPIRLSPVMEKQRVSLDFGGMTLDAALRMLAPNPVVDYVVGGNDDGQPRPLAIFLNAMNEPVPPPSEAMRGRSEALMFEGDTEDGVGDEETQRKREAAKPLRVTYAQNHLSVMAKKQPLAVVLYKVASEMGVPLDLRWESVDVVDLDFSNFPLEQAVRTLSPGARLYYRLDLASSQMQPIRLALERPASASAQ